MNKVAVLGSGSWGTALAKVLAEKGDDTHLWTRRPELAVAINTTHVNEKYLPGARLPDTLHATTDMKAALEGASMVVFVAPSHATREVAKMAAPFIPENASIVSATKGIENETLNFIDEILEQELPAHAKKHL
ncbi:MAG: 2-dehydropantoate 2-reductase N-terminal domain-containing protein, partial [Polyangiaceae bacterium]